MGILSWIALVALFFYLPPLVRFATRPLRNLFPSKKKPDFHFPSFLLWSGRLDYLIGPFRDRFLSLILLAVVIHRWMVERPLSWNTLLASTLVILLNLLAILTIRYRDILRQKMAELARTHSEIHPEDFFNLYFMMLSPWPPVFSWSGFRTVDFKEADFRSGQRPRHRFYPILESMVTTNTLAHIAMLSFHRVGPEFGRDAFDGLARLWSSRIAQIFKTRLKVVMREPIPPIEGKTILLFNHRSYLDFALNFFALGNIRKSNGRYLRPRFIAAKDHFIDNPFLYSWLGLGKVIENAGMIFVERKKKGRGWAAMREAAQKLETSDVEIAVYPQGTRAYPYHSHKGKRLDSGFYTTFTRKTWNLPLGHLKPGIPYLILESLIHLKKMGFEKLNVLVTGIRGTGIAGPKGSFLIQTETDIEFYIEPLWVIPTSFADGVHSPEGHEASTPEEKLYLQKIEALTMEINRRLLEATDYHRILRERTREELTRLNIPPEEVEAMDRVLVEADREEDLRPYILIDRILSLKPVYWDRFFHLLLSLKDKREKNESWLALLQEVSEKVRHRDRPT